MQLDLSMQKQPCTIIAFPAEKRRGHAYRVAHQLSKSRTNKEADWVLTRALVSYHDRLSAAGIPASEAGRLMGVFRRLIFNECLALGSRWSPDLDDDFIPTNGGSCA
ncbi:hypothetical protein ASD50_07575 [Mesorhizobium sp. Root552]|uniref:DUF6074 family protein n=1 Tax=Mesorhizobium sp. Root552 TaxID=1736555 RepID=UPI0006F46C8C|nr:DUF6074 family protein [Mesorhizobium sp. Root552]KQZ19336.1 hypothetical protein ASD50_07575 [Mesorhizobium sp. Root552]